MAHNLLWAVAAEAEATHIYCRNSAMVRQQQVWSRLAVKHTSTICGNKSTQSYDLPTTLLQAGKSEHCLGTTCTLGQGSSTTLTSDVQDSSLGNCSWSASSGASNSNSYNMLCHVDIHIRSLRIYTYVYIHMYMHMYTYSLLYTYTFHIKRIIYEYTYYVYIRIYIYMYMYTWSLLVYSKHKSLPAWVAKWSGTWAQA